MTVVGGRFTSSFCPIDQVPHSLHLGKPSLLCPSDPGGCPTRFVCTSFLAIPSVKHCHSTRSHECVAPLYRANPF